MKKVLIADTSKASIVMSSEIFKDTINGCNVDLASSGSEVIEKIKHNKYDMCLIDFDLPDVDGPFLILEIRKYYSGPVLLTAYPDDNVYQSVKNDLFYFDDSGDFIEKPIRISTLSKKIEDFLFKNHRVYKRFKSYLPSQLIIKAEGPGKKAPKVSGIISNISVTGAKLDVATLVQLKKNEEVTLSLSLPLFEEGEDGNLRPQMKKNQYVYAETKIKSQVIWKNKNKEVGLKFSKLTASQISDIKTFMRLATPV